MHFTKFMQIS